MRLKNILIVVNNIEKSKAFYKDMFELDVISDFGENVILSGGLVLQDKEVWKELVGTETEVGCASELFFETDDLDTFIVKWNIHDPEHDNVWGLRDNSWGKRTFMISDPDGHLIEVAEK